MSDLVLDVLLAISLLVNIILGILISAWVRSRPTYIGDMVFVQKPDGVKTFTLDLEGDPDGLENLKQVMFKVRTPTSFG